MDPTVSTTSMGGDGQNNRPSTKIIVPGLHPKIVEALTATLTEAKARGLNVALHSALRTPDQQDKLYALGRTVKNPDGITKERPLGQIVTRSKGFESWHTLGLAVDIVFKDGKGNFTWNKPETEWDQLGICGELSGFEWGGGWPKFPDRPHFQMRGKIGGITDALTILFRDGLDALWGLI